MNTIDRTDRTLDHVLRGQCDLITRAQALAAPMTEGALRNRLRAGGPWSIVLPGIYLAHNGSLAAGQREMAAILYAGPDTVITGPAALAGHGMRAPIADSVDVLVPHDRRRQSAGFVSIHRTRRMPEQPWISAGLRWAPAARAVSDAIRVQNDLRVVRALVADAVQQGKCTVEQLIAELRAGSSRGSAAMRDALDDVIAGVASVTEGDLCRLIKSGDLPEPLYNPKLYVGSDFLAQPDAWWPDAGVAGEVDSREWHLTPAAWERTMTRHARMSAQGIIVIHMTPRRLRTEAAQILADLQLALERGRQRPQLAIRTAPTTHR